MRVTDEMVAILDRALNEDAFHSADTDAQAREVLRPALEAALADVPEPTAAESGGEEWTPAYAAECTRASIGLWMERAETAEARIAELEAQLSRVREVATKTPHQPLGYLFDLEILSEEQA